MIGKFRSALVWIAFNVRLGKLNPWILGPAIGRMLAKSRTSARAMDTDSDHLRRIRAELARLGFKVSARTVAKYMRRPHDREPSPGWRTFIERHAAEIWACDFICVQTYGSRPPCLLRGQPRQP
jgi:hypothetical protein